jgi:5-formyltetrahydrofolate cyclo-ligase
MKPGPGMDKRGARRELFARTRRLSVEERAVHSEAICEWLARDEIFLQSRSVYSFLALPAEPDLSPLVAAFPDKRWAFSRVTPDDRICFHEMAQVDDAIQGDHRNPGAGPTEASRGLATRGRSVPHPGSRFRSHRPRTIGPGQGALRPLPRAGPRGSRREPNSSGSRLPCN